MESVVETSSFSIHVLISYGDGGFKPRPKFPTDRSIFTNEGLFATLDGMPFSMKNLPISKQVHVECHCKGNLTEGEARQISEVFFKSNFRVPLVQSEMREELVVCLPERANLVINEKVKSALETKSALLVYYQIGRITVSSYTKCVLFKAIVKEKFFHELRTIEHVGYDVSCGEFLMHDILGFYFFIPSSSYDPVKLQKKVDAYIENVGVILNDMSKREYQGYKDASSDMLLEEPDAEFVFSDDVAVEDNENVLLQLLNDEWAKTKKKDILDWYTTYLKRTSPQCRKLVVRVWGRGKDMTQQENKVSSPQAIKDIVKFKSDSEFYEKKSAR